MTVHWSLAVKNVVGPTETPDVDAILAYAARAEVLDFESLWAWDHVILGVEPALLILDRWEFSRRSLCRRLLGQADEVIQ